VAGTGDKVRVATTLADCGGFGCSGIGGLVVTRCEPLLDHRHQQIATLGAFGSGALQQALSTGKPAGCAAHLAAHEQTKTEPERATDRAQPFAGVTMRVIGALKRLEVFFVLSDQARRQRQLLEILGCKWNVLIRVRKRLERIRPGTLAIRSAGSIKVAHRCHRIAAGHVASHGSGSRLWSQANIAEQIGD
jgi:hypothetical protein